MYRRLLNTCLALVFLACLPAIGYSQYIELDYSLELRGEKLTPQENAQSFLENVRMNYRSKDPLHLIVQFYKVPEDSVLERLRSSGLRMGEYIPNRAYTALMTFPLGPIDPAQAGIRSFTLLRPEWKIQEKVIKETDLTSTGNTRVLVAFIKEASLAEIEAAVSQSGGVITDRKFAVLNTFEVTLPSNKITNIAASPLVKFIQLAGRDRKLNDDNRGASGSAILQSPIPAGGRALDGSGITIGIGDNNSGLFHVDTRDRVTNFIPAPIEEHGTHVTGTAAGKGIMNPRYRGMAPGAKVLNHYFNLVWAQTASMFEDYGMTLTNNSYSAFKMDSVYAGLYDQYSQMLDEVSLEHPFVCHVFAAGNDGNSTFSPYPTGYGTVAGAYQAAKNVLDVSTKYKNFDVHPGGSKGPTKDGRLKPELVAFGKDVVSTKNYDEYRIESGTSMAAPATTGALALVAQRYKQLHAGANIHGDLLKALAMNGARDLGTPGPDFINGFGFVDVHRSVLMLENNRFKRAAIVNTGSQTYSINVPPNTAVLKVMLYWHDAPASPMASVTLVNNLDLEVTEPNSTLHRPLILDPSPANVTNPAVEGVDNRNNVEQVVVYNPTPGTYTVHVKGTTVPSGPQEYALVWDIVEEGIELQYPPSGLPVAANDTLRFYWRASDHPNSFTLEYSTDGSSWSTIDNNIPSGQYTYRWQVPNISSAQAAVRISRNGTGQTAVSTFVLNPQPQIQLSSTQCPGYFAFEWSAVSGATAYEILQKIGDDLQPVDTVTATTTNYVLKGLALSELYYVGVRPFINGAPGYRSNALSRKPADGDCSGGISDNDLMAEALVNPTSGRKFTSSELGTNEPLTLLIRNLDDVATSSYSVSWSINGGSWQSQTLNQSLAAGLATAVQVGSVNLAATTDYDLRLAVTNLSASDPVPANDTLSVRVRHLPNDSVNLHNGYAEDFEAEPRITTLKDSIGILSSHHWDFSNSTDSGRLRTFISDDIVIGGARSVSLDLLYNLPENQNLLTGTFNLAGYDTATTEARVEFDYMLQGRPKFQEGNEVWIRGNDTAPWINILTLDTMADKGTVIHSGSLSVTNALHLAGQNFSSSFQLRFGQRDTSAIAMSEYGNGLTIDNIKLYSVKNDVQLLAVVSPDRFNCGTSNMVPLTVLVYNSDNLPQTNVQLFYRLNNGVLVTATIDSIAAKDTILYSFAQPLSLSGVGYHLLDVWLSAAGDTYLPNDSLLNLRIRNQPVITSYPYLENFEASDGSWFAEGANTSWEYGTPEGQQIDRAASGEKAWVTNLKGNHNDHEKSYLYSPCFDMAGLSSPMLSFSLSTDIEDCGNTLCDLAWVEYSEDGAQWTRLGATGEGTNWYGQYEGWNEQGNTRWRVASIPLPSGLSSLKLRFVLSSDPGAAREGIGVDDIHVFDRTHELYTQGAASATNYVQGLQWNQMVQDDKVLAGIFPHFQASVDVSLLKHDWTLHPVINQYFIPRSYVISSVATDSLRLKLFITDEEFIAMLHDNACDTCAKAPDAYRLGVVQYNDPEKTTENGSLIDNKETGYRFIPFSSIAWVPQDIGYYAEFSTPSLSEFWFSTRVPEKVGEVRLLPNPVLDGKLQLVWTAEPGSELSINLFDLLGRVVYSATAKATAVDNKTEFQLPQLAPAVYIARYTLQGEIFEKKLLVR